MLGTSQRTVGPAVTQRLWTISGTTRATAFGNQSCHPGESYYVSGKRSGGAHGKATWFFWRASAPRRLHICCCGGFQSGVAGSSSRPASSSATSTTKLEPLSRGRAVGDAGVSVWRCNHAVGSRVWKTNPVMCARLSALLGILSMLKSRMHGKQTQ